MKSLSLLVFAVFCALCLLMQQVAARPGYAAPDNQAIGAKERQELAKYAAKMLQILLHSGNHGDSSLANQSKRNSGMLDAVINMPDLFDAGRK